MAVIFAGTNPNPSERETGNRVRVRRAAAECAVLLENRGVLPLSEHKKKIALFGGGARYTVRGGTGSGDVNVREIVNVEQGLETAGYTVTTKTVLDRFDAQVEASREEYRERAACALRELGPMKAWQFFFTEPYVMPTPGVVTAEDVETTLADAAVYVVSRNSGEGADRKLAEGDYYLSEAEKESIRSLSARYGDLVVVLNVGGVIDTDFLRETTGIGAVLLLSQLGSETGHVLADILSGRAYPSGRLSTTWAQRYEDYPNAMSFSHMNGDLNDEYYTEGIYVGYRWFDAFGKAPAYPFGYGLGYTSFDMTAENVALRGEEVEISALVTNTGKRPEKEVVQVYVSAPDGRLEKPVQGLAGFAKTSELAPGESERVSVSFSLRSLASYDESRAAWILEPGEYMVRVGRHSRDTHVAAVLTLDEEIVTEQCENRLSLDVPMKELTARDAERFRFADDPRETASAVRIAIEPECVNLTEHTHAAVDRSRVTDLSNEELATLCVGSARYVDGETSIIGNASNLVPGGAGDTTSALLDSRGIPNITTADGPAGLRLDREFRVGPDGNVVTEWKPPVEDLEGWPEQPVPEGSVTHYQFCTAIPIATALAQSWNLPLIEDMGDLVGSEMEEFGVNLWLAPGMNIHRNPLCGRNFEYYSEDPVLAGLCAAADTAGVQRHPGRGATIKHFACNNQEDNRQHVCAHVSERALREIYLRGFETAVRTAQPEALMSSYNLLNGVHTANSFDLLTGILREEWGFKGLVMTDWGTTSDGMLDFGTSQKYGCSAPGECVRAGNDLIMPGSKADVRGILDALGSGCLTREELETCAARIVQAAEKFALKKGN